MKVGTAIAVVGGLAVVGGIVVYAVSQSGGGGSSVQRPKGSKGSTLGDLIAQVGGSAVATLGKDIASWTSRAVDSLFGTSRANDTMGPPGAQVTIDSPGGTLYV